MGFDASTSTIGICVLDFDENSTEFSIEPVFATYFKPNKKLEVFERLADTKKYLIELIAKYNPDVLVLEEIIKFMKGKTTANTITALAILNRTVGLTIFEQTQVPPILLHVQTIRHAIKLTPKLPSKDQIPEIISYYFNKPFPYIFDKKGKIKPENYDLADGCAVAIATAKLMHSNKLDEKINKKKRKKIRKKK